MGYGVIYENSQFWSNMVNSRSWKSNMGKKLLTITAIRQIINLRSDKNPNHILMEIAVAIQNEFGIEVLMDAVRKAYYKHKDTLPAQPGKLSKIKIDWSWAMKSWKISTINHITISTKTSAKTVSSK